jgi:2-haloacid dehalogenase
VVLSDSARSEILMTMRNLPAHPDVVPALDNLKAAGYRLVTLTNSPPATVASQLDGSGLAKYFEKQLSADAVRKFKPVRQVYEMAAQELGERPGDLWLVAAHNWDTTGALAAGWKAAFVARPNMVLGSLDRIPQVIGNDLIEVAEKIAALDR